VTTACNIENVTSKTPEGAELDSERRKVRIAALRSAGVCAAGLGAGYAMLPRHFPLPDAIADRLAFALQADIFVLLWVLFGVSLVSRGRRHSPVDIGTALSGPPSPRIAVEAAFLQNTLEQAVLAIVLHLALATFLPRESLGLIVASVALFALGRATFLLGYRKGAGGRAFGMVTTALPTLLGYAAALVILGSRLVDD
jgi:hypothetical protein